MTLDERCRCGRCSNGRRHCDASAGTKVLTGDAGTVMQSVWSLSCGALQPRSASPAGAARETAGCRSSSAQLLDSNGRAREMRTVLCNNETLPVAVLLMDVGVKSRQSRAEQGKVRNKTNTQCAKVYEM